MTPLRDTMLPGVHNRQNIAAAAALAAHLGAPEAAIERGISTFPGLPHRLQLVTSHDGKSFINDSKSTNADAAAVALSSYDRVSWIAGGIAKDGGIESLSPFFDRVAHTALFGRDAPLLAATLSRFSIPHSIHPSLRPALEAAAAANAPIVLFSPACASFDQFSNFEARGDQFVADVRSIISRTGNT